MHLLQLLPGPGFGGFEFGSYVQGTATSTLAVPIAARYELTGFLFRCRCVENSTWKGATIDELQQAMRDGISGLASHWFLCSM